MTHVSRMTYVFGDMLTGAIIEEIPLESVSMTRGFGLGELRATFHLDQSGKNNRDLLEATQEGRSYVICEKDTQPIWGGFVWTQTYQSQAKSVQLYCKAFEEYPQFRLIREDFENLSTEQRNIFCNLWTAMMTDSNSLQVTLPSSFSTVVTKSLTVKDFEFKTYRSQMDAIANGFDGFDWTIDVTRVGGAYVKTLRVGYPTLGSVEPIYFEYPGNILNYWKNGTMGDRGTHIFGIGAGEGSTMLVQPVTHTDLITSGFPRYDLDVSMKSINDSTLLTSLTTQIAAMRKPGIPIITAQLKGNLEPEFGSYGLGDAARLVIVDAAHPDPVNQSFDSRILGWEYHPSQSDGTEEVKIVFDAEDMIV